jgi:glutathione-dependent formaldehyde-activating enzyme
LFLGGACAEQPPLLLPARQQRPLELLQHKSDPSLRRGEPHFCPAPIGASCRILFSLERLSCHRQQHVALPRACMAGFRAVLQQRQVRAEVTPMPTITGGCLCGKIRYSADAEPAFVGLCHCHDCQKFTGSAFAAVIGLPKSAVTVTGALKGFTSEATAASRSSGCSAPDAGPLSWTRQKRRRGS